MTLSDSQSPQPAIKEYTRLLAPFSKADDRLAARQLVVTLLLYAAGWAVMILSLRVGYWLTLLLAVPTAVFLVRIFIFFHDCGHNSFFTSTRLNRQVGFWLGVLVFTPGEQWWRSHAIHHATSGNLDKRGVGDVMTITVAEYKALTPLGKLGYRAFRHPIVIFLLGPIWIFLISQRWPSPRHGRKENLSVIAANLAILALAAGISLAIGFKNYVLIQLPVIWLAGMAGIWLFYVQHQFKTVYWAREESWSYLDSAIKGASYYRLPKWLQWASGSIGFHHIHHLSPKVPNYRLADAYHSSPLFQQSPTLTLRKSLESIPLALYDEQAGCLVSFRQAG